MSKICIGIPSLGINPTFMDEKLQEFKKFGIDFLIYANYRKTDKIEPIPDKYLISGFSIIQEKEQRSIGNFAARYEVMRRFLETDYEYLLTFDIDDKFTFLDEKSLLMELGDREYVKFKFDNVDIDSIETSNYDDFLTKKFTVGIHNCLMTRAFVKKLVDFLFYYQSEHFNFGEDILFTTAVLNCLTTPYKVSNTVTAHYDDSGASFGYGKAMAVSRSIMHLFEEVIPGFNRVLSDRLLEYLFLSNFSYILYEYFKRFKEEVRRIDGLHTS